MTAEAIVFPDAAATTITFVKAGFVARGQAAVHIGSRFPTPSKTGEYLRIHRTGGPSSFFVIDDAQLTIEAVAETDERAHDIIQLARALIHSMQNSQQGSVTVYGVREFSGPQETQDPVNGRPRYVFNIQVSTRGTAA